MPTFTDNDTIRILVSTDNHVGFGERDSVRKDDSWRSFDEVMTLAKEREVDMVLLAGDLFHENKPSRQAMYQVMRSLRMNCLGEKPCELEMLSDKTECFEGAFNHVNYEDPDINVAIPVFSIHGNHDDPSGEGHLAALDLLQISGLVNYYGRTHESDNVEIKPVLLQKGQTKLALYGMSNVRDERLFRTFRDGKVKFFRPAKQGSDWFNIMSVHQNRHAYTETGYLPENFLPSFMDLVIWGHEHECLIHPHKNHETGFSVIQPGSSVATSLVPGEAETKHVAILSITGRELKSEPIRLKTVRPFKMREIVLAEDKVAKKLAKKENNRTELTRRLIEIVNELIEEANAEWRSTQDEGNTDDPPEPLIRLRVEYTAPEGGNFDCENPQRFSNRFVNKVANVNDVVQFHRKKTTGTRRGLTGADLPEESVLAQMALDSVKVEKLVREFLTAQSLTILPQNSFGDAVSQFVDKDDKHAMELFVAESLKSQVKHLLDLDRDDDDLHEQLESNKLRLEELFVKGHMKNTRSARFRPKPDDWDSDLDGPWEDDARALILSDSEEEEEEADSMPAPAARGRGKQTTATKRAAAKKATTASMTAASKAAGSKKAAPKTSHGKQKRIQDYLNDDNDDDDEDEDVVMADLDSADGESQPLFVQPPTKGGRKPAARAAAPASAPKKRQPPRRRALAISQASSKGTGVGRARGATEDISDDIDDDDDDDDNAFESVSTRTRKR